MADIETLELIVDVKSVLKLSVEKLMFISKFLDNLIYNRSARHKRHKYDRSDTSTKRAL